MQATARHRRTGSRSSTRRPEKADDQNVEILLAIKQNTEVTVKILQHVEALVSDHLAQPKT